MADHYAKAREFQRQIAASCRLGVLDEGVEIDKYEIDTRHDIYISFRIPNLVRRHPIFPQMDSSAVSVKPFYEFGDHVRLKIQNTMGNFDNTDPSWASGKYLWGLCGFTISDDKRPEDTFYADGKTYILDTYTSRCNQKVIAQINFPIESHGIRLIYVVRGRNAPGFGWYRSTWRSTPIEDATVAGDRIMRWSIVRSRQMVRNYITSLKDNNAYMQYVKQVVYWTGDPS